jgi:hypothetical protein
MDNPTSAAYVRLSALSEHDELQMYGAALLLADIGLVCAELARMRVEAELARVRLEQAGRAVEAANAAAALRAVELEELRAHVERVFGAVETSSMVVRELLRRARGNG